MKIDLNELKTLFSILTNPIAWLKQQIKEWLFPTFDQWAARMTEAAQKQIASIGKNQTSQKPEPVTFTHAPVMSAYEDTPTGQSFWDNKANDITSWAEDVIRHQANGDAHALGALADRLSTPDLSILLQEVGRVRERNQAAQEKFAADVLKADQMRAAATGTAANTLGSPGLEAPSPTRQGRPRTLDFS